MNELKQKRKELGITQIQAANACGVSRRTYQTYEETKMSNSTAENLLEKLNQMGILSGENYVSNVKYIKNICRDIFASYPEIQCAYLFGSYARGEATGKSDIDILVVCPAMGMKFYGIAEELEQHLHKKVDLITHRQIMKNENMLVDILKEGIKLYG